MTQPDEPEPTPAELAAERRAAIERLTMSYPVAVERPDTAGASPTGAQ